MIVGGISEQVDPILSDLKPFGGTELFAPAATNSANPLNFFTPVSL